MFLHHTVCGKPVSKCVCVCVCVHAPAPDSLGLVTLGTEMYVPMRKQDCK